MITTTLTLSSGRKLENLTEAEMLELIRIFHPGGHTNVDPSAGQWWNSTSTPTYPTSKSDA